VAALSDGSGNNGSAPVEVDDPIGHDHA